MYEHNGLAIIWSAELIMRDTVSKRNERTIRFLADGLIQFFGFIKIGEAHKDM